MSTYSPSASVTLNLQTTEPSPDWTFFKLNLPRTEPSLDWTFYPLRSSTSDWIKLNLQKTEPPKNWTFEKLNLQKTEPRMNWTCDGLLGFLVGFSSLKISLRDLNRHCCRSLLCSATMWNLTYQVGNIYLTEGRVIISWAYMPWHVITRGHHYQWAW